MDFGRVGGMLVIGGWLLAGATILVAGAGNSVQVGSGTIGSLALAASLAVIGSGLASLSITGPRPLQERIMRVGLGILAIGLVGSLISAVIAASLTYDPLENGPFVIAFLVGTSAILVGLPLTVLALLRHAGPTRTVGLLFLVGLLFVFLGAVLRENSEPEVPPLSAIGLALVVLGAIGMAFAGAGIGVLPLRVAATRSPSPR
jgi:drug/metabolite transporter (DMT)-like permease